MENIIPASPQTIEKSLKELSPKEFQQLLSSWFQERGIIQDMKSYLKFQMITVLKNTAIGKNMKCASQIYSLSQQAVHLIVAEYLLQNQCHFTFSLFSNEVNLTNILPQDKLFSCAGNDSKEKTKIFDKDNLINILELIGISKDSEYFTKIINYYFENQNSSVLCCLITVLGRHIEPSNSEQENKADIDFDDDFMGNICQVLQSCTLPQNTQNKLIQNIKLCYDLKRKSFESQCIKLINKFKKELAIRDKTIRDDEKQKRFLEKKLNKLQKENESLKEKVSLLLKESKDVEKEEKIVSECSLKHCSEKCNTASGLYETYRKEIEVLKIENKNQKEEMQRLSINCNELIKEFNCCQSKISMVNTKIHENTFEEANLIATAYMDRNTATASPDSDTTMTEEILQQARNKLKLLEEESKELDIRFSKFVIK